MGHPLDPIGVLFDTLAEACIASEDQLPEISSRHLSIEPSGDNRKRLHHIPVPGGVEPGQTYLILAFEVALIGETFFFPPCVLLLRVFHHFFGGGPFHFLFSFLLSLVLSASLSIISSGFKNLW